MTSHISKLQLFVSKTSFQLKFPKKNCILLNKVNAFLKCKYVELFLHYLKIDTLIYGGLLWVNTFLIIFVKGRIECISFLVSGGNKIIFAYIIIYFMRSYPAENLSKINYYYYYYYYYIIGQTI